MSNKLLLHLVVPEASFSKVLQQMVVHNLELAREHAARVDVAGVRFDGLIVAQDLRRGSRGHGSQQKTVSDAVPVTFIQANSFQFCHGTSTGKLTVLFFL